MVPISDFQPFPTGSPQVGTITQWEDGKGYGWVSYGGKRMFVHVGDFERGQRRPKAGEEIRFIPGTDSQGRNCAKQVTFVKSGGRGRVGIGGWILLCCLLVLPGLALARLPLPPPFSLPPWAVPAAIALMSAITYGMYADDKSKAMTGAWRVPESSLHLAELLGGWPGAFLAQRRLRHKCSKGSYQFVFWGIVLLYQLAAADVLLDHQLSRALIERLIR
jgi:uncharacterized membrane protein YsdA (DUF1294 family)/cold shock CspA family protein